MKIQYRKSSSTFFPGYWVILPGFTTEFGFIDHSSAGWYFASSVRVFRTRKEAAKALIAKWDEDAVWCPTCKAIVAAEGRYNPGLGGHSVCAECNGPIEEIEVY